MLPIASRWNAMGLEHYWFNVRIYGEMKYHRFNNASIPRYDQKSAAFMEFSPVQLESLIANIGVIYVLVGVTSLLGVLELLVCHMRTFCMCITRIIMWKRAKTSTLVFEYIDESWAQSCVIKLVTNFDWKTKAHSGVSNHDSSHIAILATWLSVSARYMITLIFRFYGEMKDHRFKNASIPNPQIWSEVSCFQWI